MLREEVLFIPESVCPLKTYILSRRIPGVRLIRAAGDYRGKLGDIVQLQPGARLDCCGDGYGERTVEVQNENKQKVVSQFAATQGPFALRRTLI